MAAWLAALLAALLAGLLAVLFISAAAADTPAAGAARPAAQPGPAGLWDWPLTPEPGVIRPFDKPGQRWLAGHRGVDLAASSGDAVRSPADGIVRFAGHVVDRPVLTIDHGDGTLSSFEPVTATVAVGETVTAGQTVGLLTPGGGLTTADPHDRSAPERSQPHCPNTCLHWGVRLDGEYVDPLRYLLDRRPSVLLPLAGGMDGGG
ncbi:M23 family metallopeptidase [Arthrobacter sp. Sa2CUA1]|uniref:M23 family metallopeptidase n=2 Tax=Arthrobacter gallicola TaxID=2762225 RepID=A0ABR8UTT2_9MICC|nr:M23 family metallopeptidase [Arthrobacter gallicola]